jgi:hypothetical protein
LRRFTKNTDVEPETQRKCVSDLLPDHKIRQTRHSDDPETFPGGKLPEYSNAAGVRDHKIFEHCHDTSCASPNNFPSKARNRNPQTDRLQFLPRALPEFYRSVCLIRKEGKLRNLPLTYCNISVFAATNTFGFAPRGSLSMFVAAFLLAAMIT